MEAPSVNSSIHRIRRRTPPIGPLLSLDSFPTFKAREKGLEGMRGKEEEEEGKGGRIRFDVG